MTRVMPRLVGSHEIRIRLGGISRQRTYQITGRRDFPEPLAALKAGKVWDAADVAAWILTHRPHQADLDE